MVRNQVDPARSEAAHKAWETRRKQNPEKYGNAKHKDTKPRRHPQPAPDEKPEVKWHVTSSANLTVSVDYRRTEKLSKFIDLPWVEKHRPVSLSDCIGTVIGYLKAYVRTGSIPLALIFHGEYGDGKTTCARAFVRDFFVFRGLFKRSATFKDVVNATKVTREYNGIFPPSLYIDATLSDVEIIRTRVQNFMRYSVGKWPKFVIIDEADRLGFIAQGALSSLIERYPKTRTIYTTNYLNDMMDRIVDRATGGVFEFTKPQPRSIAARLGRIAKAEKTTVKRAKLLEIAKKAPSVRAAVGLLQQECALLTVKTKSRKTKRR